MMMSYWPSLAGGMLIGLAATGFLLLNGRIAGVSGIAAGLFREAGWRRAENAAFIAGLVLGPILYRLVAGAWPVVRITGNVPLLIAAGLLVGFGTRLGSGCTSGHGVCGLARLSPRSLVAVATFVATAILTVFLMRVIGS